MQKRIYLDGTVATIISREVFRAMRPYFRKWFYSPRMLYKESLIVKEKLEASRKEVSDVLGCRPDEIIFTGSATEADNLAIRGIVRGYEGNRKIHIITTNIEHPAILRSCQELEKEGVSVTYLSVEKNGIVDPKKVKDAIREDTVLVTIMYSNNEIGTIQPIKEIGKVIREYKKERGDPNMKYPLFHTDAVQTAKYLPINVKTLGVNLMTVSGAKIHGPKGVAILYIQEGTPIKPIMFGGEQEYGLRAGTENIPNIVGMAKALTMVEGNRGNEKIHTIQKYLLERITSQFPNAQIHGDLINRVPSNVCITIPGILSEQIIIELDAHGIMASSRSACKGINKEGSHVLDALYGKKNSPEEGLVRFSIDTHNTKKEMDYVIQILKKIEEKQNTLNTRKR